MGAFELSLSDGSGPSLSSSAPAAVGTAAAGSASTASKSDHVHAHGNQASDGNMHAAAVASGAAGFLSGADKAKLDGIEALADVTDAANVTAAGALMRSGGQITGNITCAAGETFDGRDLSVDGAKLDGIPAGAFTAAIAGGTLDTTGFGVATTSYIPTLNASSLANAQRVLGIATRAGNLRNLVAAFKTAPGGADTVIFTVQTSSDFGATWSDTTLTCTITGAGKTATDTTHFPAVALYDWIAVKLVSSANVAAGPITVGLELY